ncbi:hypothetical protein N7450_011558 [Penicillium hetheringtonii]|uniref:Uncharacterized protein n=1 Tax=Penicillium hetheringtonii TaxID=911720 RepID=A0AAD6DBV6_9EURO|nr:hypothetical protein N7450_011558 [Penicillium hetheringtonii]
MDVNTAPEMDYFSFGSATVRVCPREGDELGSESNPIVISDSEPLGSPSNPIVIHCDGRLVIGPSPQGGCGDPRSISTELRTMCAQDADGLETTWPSSPVP